MEQYKSPNKFIQYELWKACKIGCKFCCNKKQKDIDKVESLLYVLEKLDDKEVDEYNEIGFIGGEFFNDEISDEKVRELFYKVFEKVANKINQGKISKLYITTALIFDMNNYLIPFLNYLKSFGILDKTLLCTSYDVMYRFYTKEREDLWKNNMLKLYEMFPEMGLHTETILTQGFIDAVLNETFSITEFCKTYHTRMDYIEPASGLYYNNKKECAEDLPGFFPTKSSYIKFLKKVAIDNKEIDLPSFLSMELRSCKIHYIDGGMRLENDDRRSGEGKANPLDKTKHYEIGFIDSEDTMVGIARMMLEMI